MQTPNATFDQDAQSDTRTEFRVEHAPTGVALTCSIDSRDRSIELGEPVMVRLEIADFEREDPTSDRAQIALHIDTAEEVLEAALAVVREAKRLRLGSAGQVVADA